MSLISHIYVIHITTDRSVDLLVSWSCQMSTLKRVVSGSVWCPRAVGTPHAVWR